MNKVILIGHLGKDPEMSYTPNGVAVTKFSLAINRVNRSANGERQTETDWYNITAWRQLAETCNTYLRKGSKVYVEGRISQRKYVDRNNVERVALDVTATDIEFLTPKDSQGQGSSSFVGGSMDDLGDLEDHPF